MRAWREDDAAAVYAACQDPELQRWLPRIPRPYTLDDARAFVTGALGLGRYQFAISEHGTVVGSIGLRLDKHETGHIGYWCAPEARRRGITTRALRRVCRYALDELDLKRLDLITDIENVASQRVAQKVGFQREGVLRSHLRHPDGRRRDSVFFSLLPGSFANRLTAARPLCFRCSAGTRLPTGCRSYVEGAGQARLGVLSAGVA